MHRVLASPTSKSSQPPTTLAQLSNSGQLFRDRYQIMQSLGRGGFGVTYLAKNVALPSEPECVIKQLSPKANNPQVIRKASERFGREAKILGKLGSHAQIPQLLDYFTVDGEFFLVQEYVKGNNLAKEVRNHGLFSELSVKRVLRELLPVLDFVHQNNVIHRDIKPPNIIRCQEDGRLVLIDFGAVKEKIIGIDEETQRTSNTQFVGTIGFAPPEQLALRPTFSSDIYSLGVTCLYLLTGKPPMEFAVDADTGELMWKSDVRLSSHFDGILSKMLRAAPCDRYQSADDVLRALDLEPYLDNLADCMNTQPRSTLTGGGQRSGSTEATQRSDGYLTPIERTAIEIRNWRSRLAAKKRQESWQTDNCLYSSNCCG